MKRSSLVIIFCVLFLSSYAVLSKMLESTMKITSPDFEHNTQMPRYATCKGEKINPPLEWSGIPSQAKSLVLIVDDPDAKPFNNGKTFIHWIAYDLKPTLNKLSQGADIKALGGKEWLNNGKKVGYYPACPPAGSGAHRYYFKLYALNVEQLPVKTGMTPEEVVALVEDPQSKYVIAKAELIGTFEQQ